jgi:hypothetical protein
LHDDGLSYCDRCRADAERQTANAPAVLALLHAIETGDVTITPTRNPSDVFAGDVEYLCSTGHRLRIFNDCNSWDYVDSVYTPDGLLLWDYPNHPLRAWPDEVANYRPSGDVASRIYGIE